MAKLPSPAPWAVQPVQEADTGAASAPTAAPAPTPTPEPVQAVAAPVAAPQPEAPQGDTVIVTAPKAFKLRIDNDQIVDVKAGVQRVPAAWANHWYAKANGVTVFKD